MKTTEKRGVSSVLSNSCLNLTSDLPYQVSNKMSLALSRTSICYSLGFVLCPIRYLTELVAEISWPEVSLKPFTYLPQLCRPSNSYRNLLLSNTPFGLSRPLSYPTITSLSCSQSIPIPTLVWVRPFWQILDQSLCPLQTVPAWAGPLSYLVLVWYCALSGSSTSLSWISVLSESCLTLCLICYRYLPGPLSCLIIVRHCAPSNTSVCLS
jgi:hypothetical protein